jgi:hypothetical protein
VDLALRAEAVAKGGVTLVRRLAMDPTRFDRLARALGRPASRRDTLGVLGGALALLRSTGLAQADPATTGRKAGATSRGRGKREDAPEQSTFPVCHNGKTLMLPIPAVQAHLNHGDMLGACGSTISQPPQGTGQCTPLLQVCWPSWLGGNACCDANAECLPANLTVPAFFCLDKSTTACTSDAECQARFTDPNIACLPHFPATCRVVPRNGIEKQVSSCCQRKLCPGGQGCAAGVACCDSPGSSLKEVCCAPGQSCTGTGCLL